MRNSMLSKYYKELLLFLEPTLFRYVIMPMHMQYNSVIIITDLVYNIGHSKNIFKHYDLTLKIYQWYNSKVFFVVWGSKCEFWFFCLFFLNYISNTSIRVILIQHLKLISVFINIRLHLKSWWIQSTVK